MDQILLMESAFGEVNFAENAEQRCACILLLDTSASMNGAPINELNEGLNLYLQELRSDSLARKRVDLAIITFGGIVQVASTFHNPDQYIHHELKASGGTPMGEAILRAIELLEGRKQEYKNAGVGYYRPWIFTFSDGEPTDPTETWNQARQKAAEAFQNKSATFFAVGVQGANMAKLSEISPGNPPLPLTGLCFKEFFKWLSASQKTVSRSAPNTPITLPPTSGWSSTIV